MLRNGIISSFLASAIYAGNAEIKEALGRIAQNGTSSRSLGGTVSDVGGYGCWCYIDSTHGKGRGKPLDELDAECKTLHHNYECLIMESELGGAEACNVDPWEVAYLRSVEVYAAMFNLDEIAVQSACETANAGDMCAVNVCKVEMSFSIRIAAHDTVGNTNPDYVHDNGFNPLTDETCPIKSGTPSERACCGSYPNRFPFKSYGGNRDCCGTHTFDTSMLECCADQTTKFIGTC